MGLLQCLTFLLIKKKKVMPAYWVKLDYKNVNVLIRSF